MDRHTTFGIAGAITLTLAAAATAIGVNLGIMSDSGATQGPGTFQNFGQNPRAVGCDMQRDKYCGLQVCRQRRRDALQDINATCRRTDCDNISCGHTNRLSSTPPAA